MTTFRIELEIEVFPGDDEDARVDVLAAKLVANTRFKVRDITREDT